MRSYRSRSALVVVNSDPLVRELFEQMHIQQIGVVDMASKSGVNKNTLKDWRLRTNPRVKDLRACFQVLGMRLVASYIRIDNDDK